MKPQHLPTITGLIVPECTSKTPCNSDVRPRSDAHLSHLTKSSVMTSDHGQNETSGCGMLRSDLRSTCVHTHDDLQN